MSKRIHLEYKEVPEIFKGALGYKGRTYAVVVEEAVTLSNNYWSGGTKSEYMGLDLATGTYYSPDRSDYGNHFTNPEVPTVKLLPGQAIIEHVIFCGKDLGIRIHLHPENVTKYLPAGPEVTRDEKIVLFFTRSLKSSYAGIKNYRLHAAKRETGITLARWETAKQVCIQKKLLNKAGAITPNGRNVVSGMHRWPREENKNVSGL